MSLNNIFVTKDKRRKYDGLDTALAINKLLEVELN